MIRLLWSGTQALNRQLWYSKVTQTMFEQSFSIRRCHGCCWVAPGTQPSSCGTPGMANASTQSKTTWRMSMVLLFTNRDLSILSHLLETPPLGCGRSILALQLFPKPSLWMSKLFTIVDKKNIWKRQEIKCLFSRRLWKTRYETQILMRISKWKCRSTASSILSKDKKNTLTASKRLDQQTSKTTKN